LYFDEVEVREHDKNLGAPCGGFDHRSVHNRLFDDLGPDGRRYTRRNTCGRLERISAGYRDPKRRRDQAGSGRHSRQTDRHDVA
jgi:hypothetical protein